MKKLFLILAIFSSQAFAQSLSCPEDISVLDVGKLVLKAEFSGLHALEAYESECLDQQKFPHYLITHSPPQEAVDDYQAFVIVGDVEYGQLEEVNPSLDIYALHFKVQAYPLGRSDEVQNFEDKVMFTHNVSKRVQKSSGCAGVLEAPKRIYLKKECINQD